MFFKHQNKFLMLNTLQKVLDNTLKVLDACFTASILFASCKHFKRIKKQKKKTKNNSLIYNNDHSLHLNKFNDTHEIRLQTDFDN